MATIPDESELLGMLMEADQSLPQVRVCEPYLNGEDSCQIFGRLLNLSPLLGSRLLMGTFQNGAKRKTFGVRLKSIEVSFLLGAYQLGDLSDQASIPWRVKPESRVKSSAAKN